MFYYSIFIVFTEQDILINMRISPDIFRAYDIRGKYPNELNEEIAERIGRAAAHFFSQRAQKKTPTVIVCRDVRESSPRLAEALLSGLAAAGAHVRECGIGTTPYFYFLMNTLRPDGGAMVTASHNPPEYNGIKFKQKGNRAVGKGTGMEDIRDLAMGNSPFEAANAGTRVQEPDRRAAYITFLAKGIRMGNITAVIDASGGATTYFLPELLNRFPNFVYKPLFFEPDGGFKKHSANPLLPAAQRAIREELRTGKHRFGVIFDGDGDRSFFFDEQGAFVRSEFIFALLADKILARHPKAAFVLTANTSRAVREYIAAAGGRVVRSRIGYSFVEGVMRKSKAALAVEISGHFHFKEMHYHESGLLAMIKLAALLSQNPRPFSQLVAPFDTYAYSGELNFSVRDTESALRAVKEFYPSERLSFLDGVTVEYPDWWANVRPSNTEPLVRVVLEARDKTLLAQKIEEIRRLIGA